MKHFDARLSPFLKTYTALLIAALGIAATFTLLRGPAAIAWALVLLLGGFVLLSFLSVRGYAVGDGRLIIQRLWWATGIELSGLVEASPAPGIVKRSFSLWSTRGVFGLVGYAYGRGLGVYRAYVTDPGKAVLLRFRSGKRVVVSPDSPAEFLATIVAEAGIKPAGGP